MRKRLLFAVVLGLGGIVAYFLWFCQEPSYQGKRLSEWVLQLRNLPSDADPEKLPAAFAIRQIGTNALPRLLRMLSARESRFKQRCNSVLSKQRLIRFRFQDADGVRRLAQGGLWALGPLAEPAIPILEANLLTNNDGEEARVLVQIGPKAFPALERALKRPETDLRLRVIGGLWQSKYHLQETGPLLVSVVKSDPDRQLRIFAAAILARTGSEPQLVVPVLLDGLTYPENDTRAEAARALVHYPEQARQNLAALERLAEDRDPIARNGAVEALRRIAPDSVRKLAPP